MLVVDWLKTRIKYFKWMFWYPGFSILDFGAR